MNDVKILGTIYPRKTTFRISGYGAVYDRNGIISTLTSMQGGAISQCQ